VTEGVTLIDPGEIGQALASCPSGYRAISGEYSFGGLVTGSYGDVFQNFSIASGWVASAENINLAIEADLHVWAVCAPNVTWNEQ
jgi:hypothetical protein